MSPGFPGTVKRVRSESARQLAERESMPVASSADDAQQPRFDVVGSRVVAEDSTDIAALDLTVSGTSLTPAEQYVPFWQEV